jgi:hypothetical protein
MRRLLPECNCRRRDLKRPAIALRHRTRVTTSHKRKCKQRRRQRPVPSPYILFGRRFAWHDEEASPEVSSQQRVTGVYLCCAGLLLRRRSEYEVASKASANVAGDA